MSAWLDGLWQSSPDGLILFTDSLEAPELQVLATWLASRPKFPALALVGGRGLLGAEALLAHPGLKILPLPWSPAGLKQMLCPQERDAKAAHDDQELMAPGDDDHLKPALPIKPKPSDKRASSTSKHSHTGSAFSTPPQSSKDLKGSQIPNRSDSSNCLPASKLNLSSIPQKPEKVQQDPGLPTHAQNSSGSAQASEAENSGDDSALFSTSAFAGEFLDGLVERFRDPLSSLSGHLQLLKGQSSELNPLLLPALRAAHEIESSLDALYLASDSHPVFPAKISGEYLAIEALKEAQRADLVVQLELDDDFLVRADESLVKVALQCARVLLSRFGGADNSELVLHCYRNSQKAGLEWEIIHPPDPSRNGSISPPPFLGLLLKRLADRLDAEAVLQCTLQNIPRVVGLAWPSSKAVVPLD
jgi:hypothetical protein